ncbi:MAG: DUF3800 domain-containing protein [Acidobacteria bacterium]|nr:DUF3800 domain-containing protein [Acidobacteriota bacterium]
MELAEAEEKGSIVAEARSAQFDRDLVLAWNAIRSRGTNHISGARVQYRTQELSIRGKRENLAGLQLADLVVSPIGRQVIGKRTHEDFRIIESKFRTPREGHRRPDPAYAGYGLVVLPK